MSQCRYEWTNNEGYEPCEGCGMSFEETRTIWYKIEDLYHTIIRYEWRPKNVWYKFKCWAWKRYTTTKPRTLGHGWCDRDALLIHTIFEIARSFLEKEGPKSEQEWEEHKIHNPGFYASWRETKEIIDWWLNKYEDLYVWGLTDEQFDREYPWDHAGAEGEILESLRAKERFKRDDEYEQLLRDKAKRIIDISPYYWT